MAADLREAVAPLRAQPDRSVLLFDFDGTLSPVVDDPAAAVALPGVAERLERLAGSYRLVGAVSGRPVAFLAEVLPPSVALSGLYGLESRRDGQLVGHPEADRWRPVVAEVVEALVAATAPGQAAHGVTVEPKGLSITLHVRTRPDLSPVAIDLAHRLAGPAGLEVRPAKMSVELHPPIAADKGTAVLGLAAGAAGVLYVGDDVGDLPAFAALDDLAQGTPPVATVAVVVSGPELPAELVAPGRVVLPDQRSVIELLDALAV